MKKEQKNLAQDVSSAGLVVCQQAQYEDRSQRLHTLANSVSSKLTWRLQGNTLMVTWGNAVKQLKSTLREPNRRSKCKLS